MLAPSITAARAATDVCLVLEGTYPYVSGGVSSWVHDLVRSMPELGFALLHIGPRPGAYGPPRYVVPENVTGLLEHYCHVGPPPLDSALREHLRAQLTSRIRVARHSHPVRSRTLRALRRLHLEDAIDDQLIEDLAAGDLDVDQLLHGDEAFDVISEIYRARAESAPFLDFFWHFRSMHVPLVRLLAAELPRARVYHSVSTGYAGALAAVASRRSGRPMLLTEHGIYARERDMELARASWIDEPLDDPRLPAQATSPLRRFWSRFFRRLSQVAYLQSQAIVTLSEGNRTKQLTDGAARDRTTVVANGVDVEQLTALYGEPVARSPSAPVRVGFVGRVVPIKDVLTFIKACDLALHEVPLAIEIIGPADEDPAYAARCRDLVHLLGRDDEIRIVGPRPMAAIFGNLDLVVLTSLSEGQPLVILEAHAAGVPVIATDVGACREMLEGNDADRDLGPSGIVTRVASPEATARALVLLARDGDLRRQMGDAGLARVQASYTKTRMINAYRTMYVELAS
jgi:glycosyltransferase involved in cell wall biosynthesis